MTGLPAAIRPARAGEAPAIEALIVASARAGARLLHRARDGGRDHARVGVDSELIADGTYLVAEGEGGIAECGGWSRRSALFGGDRAAAHVGGRATGVLDSARNAGSARPFSPRARRRPPRPASAAAS